jgi:hypothetical protein
MTLPYVPRRFTLKRVGAAQGAAIFECANLLGNDVTIIDAADYDVLEQDTVAAWNRIVELELALQRYGSHKRNACIFSPLTKDGKGRCVCGLDDVLAAITNRQTP